MGSGKPHHVFTPAQRRKGLKNRTAEKKRAIALHASQISAKVRRERGDVYFFPDEAERGRIKGGETMRKRHEKARQKRGPVTCANAACKRVFWPRRRRKGKRPVCSHHCAGALRATPPPTPRNDRATGGPGLRYV
jgi:hypothetical protein